MPHVNGVFLFKSISIFMLNFSLYKQLRRNYQPKKAEIKSWILAALVDSYKNISLEISIVSAKQSQKLNLSYRDKNYPTNVISLEYSDTRDQYSLLMGELILCDEIIVKEAMAADKSIIAHYAHMIIHGILHIQGFDHIDDEDAVKMESLETEILQKLGYSKPYIDSSV